jgi:hypothetical protein
MTMQPWGWSILASLLLWMILIFLVMVVITWI